MQIRLTVLGPRSGPTTRACDVLVTAPAGTALAAVAGSLAASVAGPGADTGAGGGSGPVVLYAGTERLDPQRAAIGEPPLIDGAVLSLQGPGPAPAHGLPHGTARLRVISGPDAGGVHLLHGGQIRIGRSADADVPLDDPDVSRLHCAVTVEPDGSVHVADLRSTNGTAVDGTGLGDLPAPLPPGALLRIGESTLRLQSAPTTPDPALETTPDGEGRLRISTGAGGGYARVAEGGGGGGTGGAGGGQVTGGAGALDAPAPAPAFGPPPAMATGPAAPLPAPRTAWSPDPAGRRDTPLRGTPAGPAHPEAATAHGLGHGPGLAAGPGIHEHPRGERPDREPQNRAHPDHPGHGHPGHGLLGHPLPGNVHPYGDYPYGEYAPPGYPEDDVSTAGAQGRTHGEDRTHGGQQSLAPAEDAATEDAARYGAAPRKGGRRGGIGAWARRLTGGRPTTERPYDDLPAAGLPASGLQASGAPQDSPAAPPGDGATPPATSGTAPDERWPDAAAVLLTALGPGPRLWERGPDHPDTLTVRLGTAGRNGGRTALPVTIGLRRAGSLGLAGPRARLAGLARSAIAQLAALHSPATLDIVLISTDRARTTEERVADWSWLGWLPHLHPSHGQDCRLLLAYDKEQATARTAELVRRLDDCPLGPGWASAERAEIALAAARHQGPFTLLIVDGDPGSSALRETTARLATAGAAAGVHLLCLAETPAASPAFPLAATYEAARAASPAFGECGAVAVLSGDVATAVRVVQPGSGPNGTIATVDAVSAAWAERFARALAPLHEAETTAGGARTTPRAAVPLPATARLLDELGLARATPASLMARWAATLDTDRPGATAVLGAGPHGPVCADLAAEGAPLLVEGPAAGGKTELLRSLAASLAAADRPDLLSLVLVDGGGTDRGEGLRVCTDLPHVTTYLAASDPVRMRAFAQALSSELKRRAEILSGTPFTDWRTKHLPAPRVIAPRRTTEGRTGEGRRGEAPASGDARHPEAQAPHGPHAPHGPQGAQGARGAHAQTAHAQGVAPTAAQGAAPTAPQGRTYGTYGQTNAERYDAPPTSHTPESGGHPDNTSQPTETAGTSRSSDYTPYGSNHGEQELITLRNRCRNEGGSTAAADPSDTGTLASTGTLRLRSRPGAPTPTSATPDPDTAPTAPPTLLDPAAPMPRLFILVDDFDALVAPALGSPGRPAAGSVVRALEAVARDGAALGVHLIAATGHPDRTADTATSELAALRIELGASDDSSEPAPVGRGRLHRVADGSATPFQAGRVTGRIPRTSTLRPTVVPLEWQRMGDPPARRPLRELGNGPTDLALLASALQRAAQSSGAPPAAPLI
ncbi:FHA domain-containing protein [Streptomyces sp. NRRL S-337]|uniref:FHA domain-containing protein n=1 Tax=Streptomyces sp. NRRL S-337 TaxID=1463900 RepID=UPI0004C6F8BC|nr:FHA domain-containing protein [Streptomyces sp. NRRL S-337]